LKHRGTEAQRIPEGEREGGQREERGDGGREGGEREGRMGMGWDGMGIKKAPFRGKGAFIVFKCWPSDC
jgi:hypothetical protein